MIQSKQKGNGKETKHKRQTTSPFFAWIENDVNEQTTLLGGKFVFSENAGLFVCDSFLRKRLFFSFVSFSFLFRFFFFLRYKS